MSLQRFIADKWQGFLAAAGYVVRTSPSSNPGDDPAITAVAAGGTPSASENSGGLCLVVDAPPQANVSGTWYAAALALYANSFLDTTTFVDPVAPTKKARLDAGNVTAAQTRIVYAADRDVDLDYALQRAFVTVTAAQLRALAATQKQLVAAPGATKFLEFVSAHLWLDYGTVAHDAPGGGCELGIRYTDGSGQQVAQQTASGFIDATADAHRIVKATVATSQNVTPVANAALVLDNVGASEYAGTGDSLVYVEVLYIVRTLEPV